jgi:prevent-host-death family protein
VSEAKRNFSKYLSNTAYNDEKIVITKRGKPVAALISIKRLKELNSINQTDGLIKAIGRWDNFEEISEYIFESYNKRNTDRGRDVSFLNRYHNF